MTFIPISLSGSAEYRLEAVTAHYVPPLSYDEMARGIQHIFTTEPDSYRARRLAEILETARQRRDRCAHQHDQPSRIGRVTRVAGNQSPRSAPE